MSDDGHGRLEAALAQTEADAETTLRAAGAVTQAVKRFRSAAQVGNLRELRPAIEAARLAIAHLERQLEAAEEGWSFDEEAYFAAGEFQREVVATAEQMGVRVFEEDDRLYASPVWSASWPPSEPSRSTRPASGGCAPASWSPI
jgi:hypothetical protein